MKIRIVTRVALLFGCLLTSLASGQTPAQEQAAKLRSQLAEVQASETEQLKRLQELEEALKPENIEHSLTGVGSTRPEELREQRRRQLEKERTSVRTQLDQLVISRTRLETAIATADARAYHDSARGPEATAKGPQLPAVEPSPGAAVSTPRKSAKTSRRKQTRRPARRAPAVAPVKPVTDY